MHKMKIGPLGHSERTIRQLNCIAKVKYTITNKIKWSKTSYFYLSGLGWLKNYV